MAYDHYRRATLLDREDGAAYDGLARIWRDWGMPHLGLGDARRAASRRGRPGAQQLGTSAGARESAQGPAAYEQALVLDPSAAYALNNLCYLSFVEARPRERSRLCKRASALDPSLVAARHNLALVYAADNLDLAERELLLADAKSRAYTTSASSDWLGATTGLR